MRNYLFAAIGGAILICGSVIAQQKTQGSDSWSMNSTIIEACSCPMFCQCYFNTKPAGHAGHDSHAAAEHFCKFNNAFRVNKGKYGSVSLDGAKFWVAGDLGGDFSMGQTDWAILHFDPSVKKEQRDGIAAVLGKLYPVKWNSFKIGDDYPMEWRYTKDMALAKLDGGKAGEVSLKRFPGNTNDPIKIINLKYFGAQRNDGFIMMPNEVEAYRLGDKKYEYKGTNGFMITVDLNSEDEKK